MLDEFKFSKANLLGQAVKYLQALRSILLAHPLETDRHPKYGFDGDFISVDMGFPKSPLFMIAAENFLRPKCSKLSLDGMQRNEMIVIIALLDTGNLKGRDFLNMLDVILVI
ncbi:MAG: hypothetical protein IKZ85_07495 [Pseudobutyrivibrio sp.]|nr:hypothetical protein [Pseudobutyrivibrio sp.]